MVALVDCNNFYASCERVFRPELNGKPIVVLSNNDGCVIARSNEAKKMGIPMGAPAFKFKEDFKRNGIFVFSSNYALYGDMSNRVMTLLSKFTPEIEIYSIDEAFLCLKGFGKYDLEKYGLEIREHITRSTGIPISIGIAPTKSLAKVANKVAKKFPEKTKGVYLIDTEEKRKKALKWLPVEDVWGIGFQHSQRLKNIGVKSALDFTLLHDSFIKKQMSIVGYRLQKDLQGIEMIKMDEVKDKKSISTTRSFEEMYFKYEDLRERITTFAVSCAEKLRKQKSECSSLIVFLHTNGFREDLPQYSKSVVIKTELPTNSSIDLIKYAVKGLDLIFKDGYSYKKAGVIIADILPENTMQLSLLKEIDTRHSPLMKTIDKINMVNGFQVVKFGYQDLNRVWKMNQCHLSPRYTTRLSEIIKVNS